MKKRNTTAKSASSTMPDEVHCHFVLAFDTRFFKAKVDLCVVGERIFAVTVASSRFLNQGKRAMKMNRSSSGFLMIKNSWVDAVCSGSMTQTAFMVAAFLARQPDEYDFTVRNVARGTGMSQQTVQAAVNNLIELRLASPVSGGSKTMGFQMDMNLEPYLPQKLRQSLSSSATESEAESATESEAHNKTPENCGFPSSLRSEGKPPAATFRRDVGGQVMIDFRNDSPAMSDRDIRIIMEDIRSAKIGDPEEEELRSFILDRISFIQSAEFRGKPLDSSGPNAAKTNRGRVVALCMGIVRREGFRWKTSRARKIDQPVRTYGMADGQMIDRIEFEARMRAIQEARREIIRDEMTRRPADYTRAEWADSLEERYTPERVAEITFGPNASAYIPAGR